MEEPPKSILSTTEMPDPTKDLTGKRFGKWVVLEYAGKDFSVTTGMKCSRHWWLCRCECGAEKTVVETSLIYQRSKQCRRCARTRHGLSKTKLYRTWHSAKLNGILSEEWQDFAVFRKAVGEPPDDAARLV